jgi:hypothetical protein
VWWEVCGVGHGGVKNKRWTEGKGDVCMDRMTQEPFEVFVMRSSKANASSCTF